MILKCAKTHTHKIFVINVNDKDKKKINYTKSLILYKINQK